VVGVVEGDNRLPAGVGARDLHGVLHRLGSGVEQRRSLLVRTRSEPRQLLADRDVALIRRDHEAAVGELADLLADVVHHRRGCIADTDHRDAGAEVDERVVVDVNEHPTACAGDVDGQRGTHAAGHGGRATLVELSGPRAGQAGDQPSLLRQVWTARAIVRLRAGLGHVRPSRDRRHGSGVTAPLGQI